MHHRRSESCSKAEKNGQTEQRKRRKLGEKSSIHKQQAETGAQRSAQMSAKAPLAKANEAFIYE